MSIGDAHITPSRIPEIRALKSIGLSWISFEVVFDIAGDHNLYHLEQAKYMRKPYVLVSGTAKKSLPPLDGSKEYNNSSFQNNSNPDDHTRQTTEVRSGYLHPHCFAY